MPCPLAVDGRSMVVGVDYLAPLVTGIALGERLVGGLSLVVGNSVV